MDLSIVIVSWNARDYLEQCLLRLEEQERRHGYHQEIIVVDNASIDGSDQMVEMGFPRVRLIRNSDNLGFARANNIGLKEAKGRYLALVNSDVEIQDECLKNLMVFMDQHAEVGIAGPRILNRDNSLQPSCRKFPGLWNNFCQAIWLNKLFPKQAFFSDWFMSYWDHRQERKVDVLSGCFLIVRREAFEQVGGLDEQFFIYGEDIDWCRRFWQKGWQVVFTPEAQAIHYGGASSANSPIRFLLEMQKANLKYWHKYHSWAGQQAYQAIIFLRYFLRWTVAGIMSLLRPSKNKDWENTRQRSRACLNWMITNNE